MLTNPNILDAKTHKNDDCKNNVLKEKLKLFLNIKFLNEIIMKYDLDWLFQNV